MKFLFINLILSFSLLNLFAEEKKGSSPEQLKKDVEVLCSIKPARNYKNVEQLDQAAKMVFDSFKASGLKPSYQDFRIGRRAYKNVIARYGVKERTVVIGAHYDVHHDTQGADDNASGVAGLMELARLITKEKPDLPFSIEFVAYTLEEPPFFRTKFMGSYFHAEKMHKEKRKIDYMISIESIGYYTKEHVQKYPIKLLGKMYPKHGDFIAVVTNFGSRSIASKLNKHYKEKGKIESHFLAAPGSLTGVDFSDHLNYWKFKYKAFMITDTALFRNKNYHTKEDTPETLNYEKMAHVIDGLYTFLTKKEEVSEFSKKQKFRGRR